MVKAIADQSMKRNQLCFPQRAMIASLVTRRWKYLRSCRPRERREHAIIGKIRPTDPRKTRFIRLTPSAGTHSSPISDKLTGFMLASRVTTQIHFIDSFASVDIESGLTRAR
ncbi:hypothetical protein [Bradyrhizobium sp. UFLA05-112]